MKEGKLIAAAGIFLLLTAVKIFVPGVAETMRSQIVYQIDRNIDYEAMVVTLSEAVESCSKYLSRQREVWQPSYTAAPSAEPSYEPEPSPSPEPKATETKDPKPIETKDPEPIEEIGLPFEYGTPLEAIEVGSGFGSRMHPIDNVEKFHYGLDLSAGEGETVSAFASGVVTAAGYSDSYGNYIIIDHDGVYSSLYAHCSSLLVQAGDTVEIGQAIALVGHTGNATGPHLHFELRENGECIDPGEFLC